MYYQYICDIGEEKISLRWVVRSARESRSVALVWRVGILVTGAWFCAHGKQ